LVRSRIQPKQGSKDVTFFLTVHTWACGRSIWALLFILSRSHSCGVPKKFAPSIHLNAQGTAGKPDVCKLMIVLALEELEYNAQRPSTATSAPFLETWNSEMGVRAVRVETCFINPVTLLH
jgi:hypothetical protein